MTFDENEAIFSVAMRLRGEALRYQHDAAEAYINARWFDYQKFSQMSLKLIFQSNVCLKTLST
jgi:hypothetical protein